MAIYVTGDIHARPERLSGNTFAAGKELTKDDYVIICGDFGLVWNKDTESRYENYWLEWLDSKPWTTLFLDGNHENFDRLLDFNNYPCEMWNGGIVQRIRPSIIHLMRGEIYNLQGLKFFVFGGNYSHDISDGILEIGDPRIKIWQKDYSKLFRVNHLSWWKQEVPNVLERDNAIRNLSFVNNKVDFILTHALPSSDIYLIDKYLAQPNEFEVWLEENIRAKVNYVGWISGHYHIDKAASYKDLCIYERILQIL